MTEREIRNLQVYIGKRNQGQTDEQVIDHIEKINRRTPLTQEDWHKLIVPCCNNGDFYVLQYVLQKIDTLNNLLQYMQHTVYGRNEYLNKKRIDVLRMFMEYLGDNRTEYLNETMISAAWFGETEIVKFLIENGADKMYQNVQGLNLEKCAERAETQFKDSSLKEFLVEDKKGKNTIWSKIKGIYKK